MGGTGSRPYVCGPASLSESLETGQETPYLRGPLRRELLPDELERPVVRREDVSLRLGRPLLGAMSTSSMSKSPLRTLLRASIDPASRSRCLVPVLPLRLRLLPAVELTSPEALPYELPEFRLESTLRADDALLLRP